MMFGADDDPVVRIFSDAQTGDDSIYLLTTPDGRLQIMTDQPEMVLSPYAVKELRKALQKWERIYLP